MHDEKANTNDDDDKDVGKSSIFFDISHSQVPVVTMITIIGFFMWATYTGMTERARLEAKITYIESLVGANSLRISDRWTRSDQALFCLNAQILNPTWKCPYDSVSKFNDAPSIDRLTPH